MNWFWPIATGKSFFDVWTIVHLSFWIFAGHIPWVFGWNRVWSFIGCLAFAFGWEVFEHFMIPRHPHVWLNSESWWNSWLSDPLTCVVGVLFIWYALDHWRV